MPINSFLKKWPEYFDDSSTPNIKIYPVKISGAYDYLVTGLQLEKSKIIVNFPVNSDLVSLILARNRFYIKIVF